MRFLNYFIVCCLWSGGAWAAPKCLDIAPLMKKYDSDTKAREGLKKLKASIDDFFMSRGEEEIPSVMELSEAEELVYYLQHKGFDVLPIEQSGRFMQNMLGVGVGTATAAGLVIGVLLVTADARGSFLKFLQWITLGDTPLLMAAYGFGIPVGVGFWVGDEVATRRCDLGHLILVN